MTNIKTIGILTSAAVKTKVTGNGRLRLNQDFDVWRILSPENNVDTIDDESFKNAVNEVVETYKELFVEEAKKIDTKLLKQTICLNVKKQTESLDNLTIEWEND